MFNSGAIYEIKDDYMKTLEKCDEVTLEQLQKTSGLKRLGQSLLKLFAPLM
jgi:cardiolipin synthase